MTSCQWEISHWHASQGTNQIYNRYENSKDAWPAKE